MYLHISSYFHIKPSSNPLQKKTSNSEFSHFGSPWGRRNQPAPKLRFSGRPHLAKPSQSVCSRWWPRKGVIMQDIFRMDFWVGVYLIQETPKIGILNIERRLLHRWFVFFLSVEFWESHWSSDPTKTIQKGTVSWTMIRRFPGCVDSPSQSSPKQNGSVIPFNEVWPSPPSYGMTIHRWSLSLQVNQDHGLDPSFPQRTSDGKSFGTKIDERINWWVTWKTFWRYTRIVAQQKNPSGGS